MTGEAGLRMRQRAVIGDLNIQVIWYPYEKHEEAENIQFLTYISGLKELICDSEGILIENFKRRPEENEDEFCQRKLRLLQVLADEKTLLIIDNFDVENDPWLKRFLEGKYRVIFTTRYPHSGYSSLKVDIIEDMEALINIFSENYGSQVKDKEYPYIEEIFFV